MLRCLAGADRSVTRQQQPSASASTSSVGLLTSMMARMLHCSRPEAACKCNTALSSTAFKRWRPCLLPPRWGAANDKATAAPSKAGPACIFPSVAGFPA